MILKSIVSLACVAAAAAQAIKGKAFDHIFILFLENSDFSLAAADPSLSSFASQGIVLNNYYGVSHPSEPNYIAITAGDYFGLNDDGMHIIPSSYKTIVDLLDIKGLTWKTYQEDIPWICYPGFQSNGLYVRKHNPFIMFDSIATNATRCSNIVPATQLQSDLAAGSLPNYSFYPPNLTDDGQNTTVSDASKWLTTFLTPLLTNTVFINNTLVVVTFDESETYNAPNRVYTLLLGDAVTPLKATTDSTFYTHYSLVSTIEANWGLGNLGRQDTNMTVNNVFEFVAKAAGVTTNNNISIANAPLMNGTEPGFLAFPSQSFGSPSGSTPTNVGPMAPTGSPSAKIIGGVVGGAVAVAVIVGFFVYQKRQSKKTGQNKGSQKLEVGQPGADHLSHVQQPHNFSSAPILSHPPNASMWQPPVLQQSMSQHPMSQPPVFQQQFVFSSHPAPKVSTYGSDTWQQQQQQQQRQHHQQPVPLVWEPQPFVPPAAPSGTR